MSVKIEGPWTSDHLVGIKLTHEQYAFVIQTINRWAQAVAESESGAGHGDGYFKQTLANGETRASIRQQMAIDIAHSGLLYRMLTGDGPVTEQDPRDKKENKGE
jgi:hypothetical protein